MYLQIINIKIRDFSNPMLISGMRVSVDGLRVFGENYDRVDQFINKIGGSHQGNAQDYYRSQNFYQENEDKCVVHIGFHAFDYCVKVGRIHIEY